MTLASRLRRYLGINLLVALERELGHAAAAAGGAREGIECRVLAEHEALAFAADPDLELDAQRVSDAYAEGGVCLGALQAGRLIAYSWLAYADTRYARRVSVRFDGDYRYSYKSFVRPAYRGRRIVQALHALADDPALRRGRRRALNLVEIDNCASLTALQRAGSRPLGYVGYARYFGLLFAFHSPGARRAGIRFCAPARVREAARMRPCLNPESSA